MLVEWLFAAQKKIWWPIQIFVIISGFSNFGHWNAWHRIIFVCLRKSFLLQNLTQFPTTMFVYIYIYQRVRSARKTISTKIAVLFQWVLWEINRKTTRANSEQIHFCETNMLTSEWKFSIKITTNENRLCELWNLVESKKRDETRLEYLVEHIAIFFTSFKWTTKKQIHHT